MGDSITIVFNTDPGTYSYGGVTYTRTSDTSTFTYVSPAGISSIGYAAFGDVATLISVSLPVSVTSIADRAFQRCTNLLTINFPSNITSLGNATFYGCAKLTSLTIPSSVTGIGDSTFQNCSGLTSVTFSETSKVASIGASAFQDCTRLASIIIPSLVTSISAGAFFSCNSITSITIPPSLASIGSGAFYGVPESVTIIANTRVILTFRTDPGTYTYGGVTYTRITSNNYVSPPGVTSIASSAFINSSMLKSVILPSSVTSIGSASFHNCNYLESINIPYGITTIEYNFEGCVSLRSIIFPTSVTTIANNSFNYCTSLKTLVIPSSVTSIGGSAFSQIYRGGTIPTIVTDATSGPIYGGALANGNQLGYTNLTSSNYLKLSNFILQFSGAAPSGKSGYISFDTNYLYYNGLFSSVPTTFQNNTTLTNVIMLLGVTSISSGFISISNSAFSGCSGLSTISIPSSVTSIEDSAFNGCSSVSSLTFALPSLLTTIGNSAFYGCSRISSVFIPTTVTSIGDNAFNGCSSLSTLIIPSSVTSIGSNAFNGISSSATIITDSNISSGLIYNTFPSGYNLKQSNFILQFVGVAPTTTGYTGLNNYLCYNGLISTIPTTFQYITTFSTIILLSGITSIAANAFYNCSGLIVVDRLQQMLITSIGDNAFYNCTSLLSINISSGVTYIGNSTFYNCTSLLTVLIPEGVTTIGNNAFQNCTSLKSVNIPSSITSISTETFRSCRSLLSITIPSSVTYIGPTSFYSSGVRSIILPSSVTYIGSNSFADCNYLESINIPYGITTIETNFENCTSLRSIIFPTSVTTIANNSFNYCTGLKTIVIPSSVTSIGTTAFSQIYRGGTIPTIVTDATSGPIYGSYALTGGVQLGYTNLTSSNYLKLSNFILQFSGPTPTGNSGYISFDTNYLYYNGLLSSVPTTFQNTTTLTNIFMLSGVTIISNSAFNGCSGLLTISIPSSVTSIEDSAFSGCSSVSSLTFALPSLLTSIGNSTFYGCSGISSVFIPLSTTSISSNAFNGCSSLSSIIIPSSVTSIGSNAFNGIYSSATIITDASITSGLIYNTFPSGYNLKQSNFILQFSGTAPTTTGYTVLNNYLYYNGIISTIPTTFQYITTFSTIILLSGITSIGANAFVNCFTLSRVIFINSSLISSIGDSAFNNCNGLTSITIPRSVLTIGVNAFNYCTSLSTLTFADSSLLTNIGNNAFYTCRNLVSLIIPSSVVSIGNTVFAYCYGLKSVTISEGVKYIGTDAFASCTGITSLTIPASMISMNSAAFNGCTNLLTVTCSTPSSLTAIGVNTFRQCSKLISLNIPSSVKIIYDSAFQSCTNLTTVLIEPLSLLTSINDYAFYQCSNLSTINLQNGVTYIGSYAFDSCTKLTSINIPSTVTNISTAAFNQCTSLATVTIPTSSSLKNIGNFAFYNCYTITSINIPDGVTSIGTRAFMYCASIQRITIPSSVTSITGDANFYGCSSLSTIAIASPSSLTSFDDIIWYSSASYIPSLTALYLSSNIKTIKLTGNYPNLTIFTDGVITSSLYTNLSSKVSGILYNTYVSPWEPVYPVTQAVITPSPVSATITQNTTAQTVTGKLNISTYNSGGSAFTAQSVTGVYGTFSIDVNGNWSFIMNNAHKELNLGQQVNLSFPNITARDGTSNIPKTIVTTAITINIIGAYDSPTISVTSGQTTYNLKYIPMTNTFNNTDSNTIVSSTLNGILNVNKFDSNDTTSFTPQTILGTYGTFSIDISGNCNYDLSMNPIIAIKDGVTKTDTFTCSTGVTGVSQIMTFNITGTNTAANTNSTPTGNLSGAITVNPYATSPQTASGSVIVTDPNTGENECNAQTNVQGDYGSFTIDVSGNWIYTANQSKIIALVEGKPVVDTFTVTTKDKTLFSFNIPITITPVNTPATKSGNLSGAITVNPYATSPQTASGRVIVTDPNTDENECNAQTNVQGTCGSFTIDVSGNWIYTANQSKIIALVQGNPAVDTFTVTSKDKTLFSFNIPITITPVNTPAIVDSISSTVAKSLQVDHNATVGQVVYGKVVIVDPNTDEAGCKLQNNIPGIYGTFSIDVNGNWSYTTIPSIANTIRGGYTKTEKFSVTSTDGTIFDNCVTITLTDENTPASINSTPRESLTGLIIVDPNSILAQTASGTITVTDINNNESLCRAQNNTAGTYGVFSINVNGNWSYIANQSAIIALELGQNVYDKFSVTSVDGTIFVDCVTITILRDVEVNVSNREITLPILYVASKSSFEVYFKYVNVTTTFNAVSTPTNSGNSYGKYTLTADGQFNYVLNSISKVPINTTYTDYVTIYAVDTTPYRIYITIDPTILCYSNNFSALTNVGFNSQYFVTQINSGNIPVSFISQLSIARFALTDLLSSNLSCIILTVTTNSFTKPTTNINGLVYTYINTTGAGDIYISQINQTNIGDNAFNIDGIKNNILAIIIPKSVTSVSSIAFNGCIHLNTMNPTNAAGILSVFTSSNTSAITLSNTINVSSQLTNSSFNIRSKKLRITGNGKIFR